MKLEYSSGGIVFKKENNALFVLLAQHGLYHGWGFPKGLIGDTLENESKEDTAVREVKEETGIDAKILKGPYSESYWYVYKGEKRKKTVYYYIMEFVGGDFSQKDQEMENVEWLPIIEVEQRLSFKQTKKLFLELKPEIEKLAKVN